VLDIFTVFSWCVSRRSAALLRHAGRIDLRGRRRARCLAGDRSAAVPAALADRPALLLSSLLVVLGMQLFALGLLGELIIFTHARAINDYQVEEVVRYGSSTAKANRPRPCCNGLPRSVRELLLCGYCS